MQLNQEIQEHTQTYQVAPSSVRKFNSVRQTPSLGSTRIKFTEHYSITEHKPYYINRIMENRHRECPGEVISYRNLQNASSDNQLLKPSTVRSNNRLKAKPAVSRNDKKLILQSFSSSNKEYLSVSPMNPIYNMFKQRYEQRERDRVHQHKYFDRPTKIHLSKAIQYTLQQVLNYMSVDDIFKIKLERSDFERTLKKQPKLLRRSINIEDLTNLQKIDVDKELSSNRKIQLIINVFSDPHFNARDREVLYQVLIFQIQQTQKQVAKLEKASSIIKGLNRFSGKKEGHLEQLAIILEYMNRNYDELVKKLN